MSPGAVDSAGVGRDGGASPEQLCVELDHWLRNHRGMFGNRLRAHRKVLRRVMAFCCTATGTAEDLAAVTPEAVFAFLECCAGRAGWRLPYVRNILRFLFWSGRIPQDLSATVPGAAGGRPDGLPRHLEGGVVRKLLEAIRGDRPCDLRSHAMLLLMARLGLRAQEVVAARLDDIDWGAGRMLVRGKGGQLDRVPIPVDVGEAIVAWVRGGRRGDSRHLFVCVRPPYAPLTSSEAIRDALRNAYRRADLVPPGGQARTHALRHGLAMTLLDRGSSLAEIGDVLLRHRLHQRPITSRPISTHIERNLPGLLDIVGIELPKKAQGIPTVLGASVGKTVGKPGLMYRPVASRSVSLRTSQAGISPKSTQRARHELSAWA